MASKKSGLGRGLDSIFLDNTTEETQNNGMLRVADIEPRKNQPRKNFSMESLQELADSIAKHGVIQPVVVRESVGGYYEIIAGERRWRAAKLAGLSEIPAVVMTADDQKTAEMALIENVQREDLNPIEEAFAYKRLSEEYGMTQEKVAAAVGKSRSAVANTLRLLDLPEECYELLSDGKISEGHAKVLLGLNTNEQIVELSNKIAEKELSVRETEVLVKKMNSLENGEEEDREEEENLKPVRINYNKVLAEKASKTLGRRVNIGGRGKSKRLELYYEDREDLEELLQKLCGSALFEDEIDL